MIDLHLHSTASDGSLTPEELVDEAARAGISTLALTDHDSTAGLESAAAQAAKHGLQFIAGIELGCSTEFGPVDVLGYHVPLGNQSFEEQLEMLRGARNRRNKIILDNLSALGMPITLEELSAEGQGTLGRPHIAVLMLRKGYVKSIRESFDRFLGAGKAAYAPKEDFSVPQAVSLLSGVGALPVIAHPMLIRAPWEWLEELTASLLPYGLCGLEAYHSEHDARGVRKILSLADKYGLIVTGGSDFHGAAKPHIFIGRGKGSLVVPETVLRDLQARLCKNILA